MMANPPYSSSQVFPVQYIYIYTQSINISLYSIQYILYSTVSQGWEIALLLLALLLFRSSLFRSFALSFFTLLLFALSLFALSLFCSSLFCSIALFTIFLSNIFLYSIYPEHKPILIYVLYLWVGNQLSQSMHYFLITVNKKTLNLSLFIKIVFSPLFHKPTCIHTVCAYAKP